MFIEADDSCYVFRLFVVYLLFYFEDKRGMKNVFVYTMSLYRMPCYITVCRDLKFVYTQSLFTTPDSGTM